MEYSFYLKGSHRRTEVCREDILSAARDAAYLFHVADHEHLLWLPPLPPLTHNAAWMSELAPRETVEPNDAERLDRTPVTLDLVGMGRACFSIFLDHAEQQWHLWQQHRGVNREARLRYTVMVCGCLDAVTSLEALEQVRTHLLATSGVPSELMAPEFAVAVQELVSLQTIFSAPYERLAYHLFLNVLALTCLAVPLEQAALSQLREALTPIEQLCSAQLREIEAEQEEG